MVQSDVMIRGEETMSNLPQPGKFVILLILGIAVVFAYKHFEDGYEKIDGKWIIKPEFKDKIDDKEGSFDDCEVYYLIALTDGYYECPNCMGKRFFLFAGEIAKIGMTCTGAERYNQVFYAAQNVRYLAVFRGTSYECQKEEIRRLGAYAWLPENMLRPDRSEQSILHKRYKLLYPVFNTSLK